MKEQTEAEIMECLVQDVLSVRCSDNNSTSFCQDGFVQKTLVLGDLEETGFLRNSSKRRFYRA